MSDQPPYSDPQWRPPPGAYPPGAYPPGAYPPGAYPPGGYQPGGYQAYGVPGGPAPQPGRSRTPVLARIGHRAAQRPAPRFGVTLAGTGVTLVVLGVLVWGGGHLFSGVGERDFTGSTGSRNVLGVMLALAVTVAGYVLAAVRRNGPLVAAGVAASALGVPVFLGFATFDLTSGDGLPFSVDAVVLVSIAAWVVSYLYLPAVRGHSFYLALAVIAAWVWVLQKVDSQAFGAILFGPIVTAVRDTFGADPRQDPNYLALGLVSLAFGLGYLGAALELDRRGRSGLAHPFLVGGLTATTAGVLAMANEWHEVGTGLVLTVLGAAFARYGALAGRRFTTWLGGAGVGLGAVLLVARAVKDDATGIGVALIVVGALVVAAADVAARRLREPDEVTAPAPAPGAVH